MTIREILDGFDKELAASRAQQKRLEAMKARVLSCCKAADDGRQQEGIAGRIGCQDEKTSSRTRKRAA